MKREWFYLLIISGLVILFTSTTSSQKVNKKTVRDIDNNVYNTVTIGEQTWMVENLKTTHYRNGDAILHATVDMQWFETTNERIGAYCNYENDEINGEIYGRLYNKHVVTDRRGICPEGWHIPTSAEWKELESYLGGNNVAGGKLKEIGTDHWVNPNLGADDSSGFRGVPGGVRFGTGAFGSIGFSCYLWSSDWSNVDGSAAPWFRLINYSAKSIYKNDYSEATGFSIRCIRDRLLKD